MKRKTLKTSSQHRRAPKAGKNTDQMCDVSTGTPKTVRCPIRVSTSTDKDGRSGEPKTARTSLGGMQRHDCSSQSAHSTTCASKHSTPHTSCSADQVRQPRSPPRRSLRSLVIWPGGRDGRRSSGVPGEIPSEAQQCTRYCTRYCTRCCLRLSRKPAKYSGSNASVHAALVTPPTPPHPIPSRSFLKFAPLLLLPNPGIKKSPDTSPPTSAGG